MISLYPEFYHTFQCKAQHCRHTCCQKWTIDIDDATAALYRDLPGALGEAVRDAMTTDDDGSRFVFTDTQPSCKLLTPEGLCRIVLELGEEYLCDICHMHPRFYKYLEDLELCGIGLSCEAGVEGLLSDSSPQLFFTAEISPAHDEPIDEQQLSRSSQLCGSDESPDYSEIPDKITLSQLFRLLGLYIDDADLRYTPELTKPALTKLLTLYAATEPIDDAWTEELKDLWKRISHTAILPIGALSEENLYTRIYQYILYRQIDMLAEYSLRTLIDYARSATQFIHISTIVYGHIEEQIRRWSEQIEYDEDNVALLFRSLESRES